LKLRFLIFIICIGPSLVLRGQPEYPAGSPLFPVIEKWHEVSVDPRQVEVMRALDQPKDQPFQFAIPVEVSLDPFNSGFITRKGGETVWVLPISSKGALSLNIILSPCNLPDGAYIYVYDHERKIVR